MEKITNEMLIECLQFIESLGGEVSRYSFDRYVTTKISLEESFNIVPKKLIDEGFIELGRQEKEVKISLTDLGREKVSSSIFSKEASVQSLDLNDQD